jgi:hypothetical protein
VPISRLTFSLFVLVPYGVIGNDEVADKLTLRELAFSVHVWGLDLCILLLSRSPFALARGFAAGTAQPSLSSLFNLRDGDALSFHRLSLAEVSENIDFAGTTGLLPVKLTSSLGSVDALSGDGVFRVGRIL